MQAVWPSTSMPASSSAAAAAAVPPAPPVRLVDASVRSSGGARDPRNASRQPQQAKIEAIDAHGPGGSYQIYFAALTHRHIAIEGPAGVGKTALAERLATRLDAALVVDESANPFDGDAQGGRSGAAFQAQLFRLLTRHRQQSTLKQADLFAQATVSDYLFDKDKIYAYQTLDDNELFIYQRLFELLSADIAPPDLVIYLQAPTDVLRRRIKERRDARRPGRVARSAGRAERGLQPLLLPPHGDAAAGGRDLAAGPDLARRHPRRPDPPDRRDEPRHPVLRAPGLRPAAASPRRSPGPSPGQCAETAILCLRWRGSSVTGSR